MVSAASGSIEGKRRSGGTNQGADQSSHGTHRRISGSDHPSISGVASDEDLRPSARRVWKGEKLPAHFFGSSRTWNKPRRLQYRKQSYPRECVTADVLRVGVEAMEFKRRNEG